MAGSDIFVTFGGSTEGLEASLASAKTAVSSLTRELAALSREQAATGASADSELGQKMLAVAAQLTGAKGAVTGLKSELGGIGKEAKSGVGEATLSIGMLGDSLKHMAELAGFAFTVEAIKDWISETTEAAEKIQQMSAKLGATPEQVQTLGAEAKLAGVDFDEMATRLERMQLTLAKTGEKASPAAAALRALGIGVQEFRGATMTGQLDMLSVALSRYADGANKTAAMQALLGRSGADMIPFLDRGKAGFEELNAAIERTGAVMSGETVAAFAKTREDINEMSIAWQGLSQRIYGVVNPAVDAAVQALTRLIERMDVHAIQAGIQGLADTAIAIAASVAEFAVTAEAALDGLISKLQILAKVGDTAFAILNPEFAALKGLSGQLQSGLEGADAGAAGLAGQLAAIAKGAEDAKAKMHALLAETASPYGSLDMNAFAKPKPQPGAMNIGGAGGANQEAKAAQEEANTEIKIWTDFASEKEKVLDGELSKHQISVSQWLAQTKDALSDELQDTIATYQAELDSANLTAQQRKAINDKMTLAEIANATKVKEAEAKAAEQSMTSWQSAMNTINGAFDSQVNGLLKGTTSWKQAFDNVIVSLTEDVIKFFLNWGLKAIENTALQLAENNSVTAGMLAAFGIQTAAAGAGTAATAAAAKPGIMASIQADVGQAFAGFSAFFAPLLGPGAPAAAAGLSGGVEATAMGMAALDVGGFVQSSGVAMIHAGETVVPAKVSTPYAGGPGGGTTHIWNVTATDPQSFVAQLRNNSSDLARTVRDVFNSQPSLRPGY